MAGFCSTCGQMLADGAVFCGRCGSRTPSASEPSAHQPPPTSTPVPPQWPGAAASTGLPRYSAPPPPPPAANGGQFAYGRPLTVVSSSTTQPFAPPRNDFASQLAAKGNELVNSLNLQNGEGIGGVIGMMIRAAMLDGQVARIAAADPNGNGKALTALLIPVVIPLLIGLLLAGAAAWSAAGLKGLLFGVTLGAVAALASVGAMSYFSLAAVGRKLSFGEIFRGLSYAQSPATFGVFPMVGIAIGLWRLPATLIAIRDMVPTSMGKAWGLLLIGVMTSLVLFQMLFPMIILQFSEWFTRMGL